MSLTLILLVSLVVKKFAAALRFSKKLKTPPGPTGVM
jgi:hypothetical protein